MLLETGFTTGLDKQKVLTVRYHKVKPQQFTVSNPFHVIHSNLINSENTDLWNFNFGKQSLPHPGLRHDTEILSAVSTCLSNSAQCISTVCLHCVACATMVQFECVCCVCVCVPFPGSVLVRVTDCYKVM